MRAPPHTPHAHTLTLALALALALALSACSPRLNAIDPRDIRTFTSFEAPITSSIPTTNATIIALDHRPGTRGPTLATGRITPNNLLRMQLTAPNPNDLRDIGDGSNTRIGVVRGLIITAPDGSIIGVAQAASRPAYYDDPQPSDRYAYLIYATRDAIITDPAIINAISGYPHRGPLELALGWNYRLFTIEPEPDNNDNDARTIHVTSRPAHPADLPWHIE